MPRSYRNLKRGLIRPDWNKYTLFSLKTYRGAPDRARGRELTLFQEKWNAKARLRGYHSPHVREGLWERMFDRRLPAVVPMDYRYMARHDGRELSAGRGSGLIRQSDKGEFDIDQGQSGTTQRPRTPYMSMTFFPLEKRLDSVIFRALFASSVQQARSMILHGGVTINGKKMIHPGYLLNPGDLFQVDVDRVMYATGAPKPRKGGAKKVSTVDAGEVVEPTEETAETSPRKSDYDELDLANIDSAPQSRKTMLALRHGVVTILDKGKKELPSAKLQELRNYKREVAAAVSKMPKQSEDDDGTTAAETAGMYKNKLADLTASLPGRLLGEIGTLLRGSASADEKEAVVATFVKQSQELEQVNPYDASKPYATPWRPRRYMSAFAFIPRYLEVNQNICAGVYLRHPVARPGNAEVPTPYEYNATELGFNWYLRRR